MNPQLARIFFGIWRMFFVPFGPEQPEPQIIQQVITNIPAAVSGVTPITFDGSGCTGSGTSQTTPCSASMTITAGDTIVVAFSCGTANFGDPANCFVSDPTNGVYHTINAQTLTLSCSTACGWQGIAFFPNSAGGSITPQVTGWEGDHYALAASALKGTRTSKVADGGSILQSATATAPNPTTSSGTPTNANEIVIAALAKISSTSATAGSGFTIINGSVGAGTNAYLANEYNIQTTATSRSAAFTLTSTNYYNFQVAFLNASNPAGYDGLTGAYAIGITKTNGAAATVADLNGSTTTLLGLRATGPDAPWSSSGTVTSTYDTGQSVPTGTYKFIVGGVAHTYGDVNVAVMWPATSLTNGFNFSFQGLINAGSPQNLFFLFDIDATGAVTGTGCDIAANRGSSTDDLTWQTRYTTATGIFVDIEDDTSATCPDQSGGVNPPPSPCTGSITGLSFNHWYAGQLQAAGTSQSAHTATVWDTATTPWSQVGQISMTKQGNRTPGGSAVFAVGKYSSCSLGTKVWIAGYMPDPYNQLGSAFNLGQ